MKNKKEPESEYQAHEPEDDNSPDEDECESTEDECEHLPGWMRIEGDSMICECGWYVQIK